MFSFANIARVPDCPRQLANCHRSKTLADNLQINSKHIIAHLQELQTHQKAQNWIKQLRSESHSFNELSVVTRLASEVLRTFKAMVQCLKMANKRTVAVKEGFNKAMAHLRCG